MQITLRRERELYPKTQAHSSNDLEEGKEPENVLMTSGEGNGSDGEQTNYMDEVASKPLI